MATQLLVEAQETAVTLAAFVTDGRGRNCAVQVLPFHTSITGAPFPLLSMPPSESVATQKAEAGHETPLRLPKSTPEGSGTGWAVQVTAAPAAAGRIAARVTAAANAPISRRSLCIMPHPRS